MMCARVQAGIPTAISSDNVRDQFYAYGDLDMLEVFTQASGICGGMGGAAGRVARPCGLCVENMGRVGV